MTGVNPLYFIVGMALLGLAPFFLMMVTSYVKIVVVTSLVRNALGVQQVPPAMVMNGRRAPGLHEHGEAYLAQRTA